MVSLRRRRLLGLCSGSSSFVAPLPLYCENITATENSTRDARLKTEQPALSDNASMLDSNNIVKEEPGSSNVSGSSSSKDQPSQQISGPPVKRRKRHRRKNLHNQEPCLMRGVYFKNMKWQAAIKVDKKQIHLGTVGSQEEAAHLYDRGASEQRMSCLHVTSRSRVQAVETATDIIIRAAFMCGREPNFELPEEEKRELRKFKWEEFLALTRQAITRKKHKRRLGSGPSDNVDLSNSNKDDSDNKQGVSSLSACEEDAEQETSLS
ncbi:ethylene-responsive transcription factor-like protein At4g13040 isoform X4 [Arachis hypogaea]|uniref:ethylene-responsive transcription factor-like protein At4g13040 isoform X4 n=1 Tax=Arachis hypogaea TaxID=3818 RepID=UPI000DECB523|nr:ethylene-responsive transcription factor-like protein At4g13040 isoform X2 [Arachis hypogaea]